MGSQENFAPSTAISEDGEEPASSPMLPVLGSQQSNKPRKPPTITPRSFTRFFTPKSSLERGGRIGASRQALRDITASASNRRGRRIATKDSIQIFDEGLGSRIEASKRRKRKVQDSADVTPDRSSPLKRIRNQSLEISEDGSDAEDEDSQGEDEELLRQRDFKVVDPIIPSSYRRSLGRDLRREIGTYGRIMKARPLDRDIGGSKDWQRETTNFFSGPEDIHSCHNVATPVDLTIPFCTASCNSM